MAYINFFRSPALATGDINAGVVTVLSALTGGGPDALDGQSPPAGASIKHVLFNQILSSWVLQPGTDATDAPSGKVRPANYAPATFEYVYYQYQ